MQSVEHCEYRDLLLPLYIYRYVCRRQLCFVLLVFSPEVDHFTTECSVMSRYYMLCAIFSVSHKDSTCSEVEKFYRKDLNRVRNMRCL